MKRSATLVPFILVVSVVVTGCGSTPDPPWTSPPTPPTTPTLAEDSTPYALSQTGLPGLPVRSTSLYDIQSAFPGLSFFDVPVTEDCSVHTDRADRFAVVTTAPGMVLAYVSGEPTIPSSEGITVGRHSIDDLTEVYGEDTLQNLGALSKDGGDLVVMDPVPALGPEDGEMMLAFESDSRGVVTEIRAGMWPWVARIDYCTEFYTNSKSAGWPLE
jgi:hypothetical protein